MSITLMKEADLGHLSTAAQDTALAIYLPLELDASHRDANRIRLKNAIAAVKDELPAELDKTQAHDLLVELESLAHHELFSANYAGLAILADLKEPKKLEVYPLWRAPETKISFGESLTLGPIAESLSRKPVSVLCLSDNCSRLFRGHQHELVDVTSSASLPENLDEVIRFEKAAGLDGNEHYKNKTVGAGSHHGEGPTSRLEGEFERRYFREIGAALQQHLVVGERLLLACVHEKAALFRDVNPGLNIFERSLDGNFEHLGSKDFVVEACRLLDEIEQEETRSEIAKVEELSPERRLSNPEDLGQAAQEGRVERLFVKDDAEIRQTHEALVMQVLRTGGQVRYVNPESWDHEALAVLRW